MGTQFLIKLCKYDTNINKTEFISYNLLCKICTCTFIPYCISYVIWDKDVNLCIFSVNAEFWLERCFSSSIEKGNITMDFVVLFYLWNLLIKMFWYKLIKKISEMWFYFYFFKFFIVLVLQVCINGIMFLLVM